MTLFFPSRGEPAGPARQVCAACPVRQQCLDYAITNRIVHGIWGGLSERERRALRSLWVRASRRERDRAIRGAEAAGYTMAAIGRSFGLSRTSMIRAPVPRCGPAAVMSRSLACTVHLWPPPSHARQCTDGSRVKAQAGPWGDVMTGPVFPADSWVQVRYPLTSEQEHADRAGWPWLPGWAAARCGPGEWEICVQAPELAT